MTQFQLKQVSANDSLIKFYVTPGGFAALMS